MFNLILKDIYINKKYFIFSFIYSLIIVFIFKNYDIHTITGIILIKIVLEVIPFPYSIDNLIINSLPTTRKEIIMSKYIFTILNTLLSLCTIFSITFISNLFFTTSNLQWLKFNNIISIFLDCIIVGAIFLPLYSKFIYSLATWISTCVIFIVQLNIHYSAVDCRTQNLVKNFIYLIYNSNKVFSFLIAITLYTFSMFLSIGFYESKDLV